MSDSPRQPSYAGSMNTKRAIAAEFEKVEKIERDGVTHIRQNQAQARELVNYYIEALMKVKLSDTQCVCLDSLASSLNQMVAIAMQIAEVTARHQSRIVAETDSHKNNIAALLSKDPNFHPLKAVRLLSMDTSPENPRAKPTMEKSGPPERTVFKIRSTYILESQRTILKEYCSARNYVVSLSEVPAKKNFLPSMVITITPMRMPPSAAAAA